MSRGLDEWGMATGSTFREGKSGVREGISGVRGNADIESELVDVFPSVLGWKKDMKSKLRRGIALSRPSCEASDDTAESEVSCMRSLMMRESG